MSAGSRRQRQIDRILALLGAGPRTAQQIADTLYMSKASVLLYTKLLSEAPRRIHVSGYQRSNSRAAMIFALGDQPDALFVRKEKADPKTPRVQMRIECILATLEAKPRTNKEVADELHLSHHYTVNLIGALRRDGKVHIKAWAHPGKRGDLIPVYALGKRKDAPRPQESSADRWAKIKGDVDKHDRHLAKRRARSNIARATAKPANWASSIGA